MKLIRFGIALLLTTAVVHAQNTFTIKTDNTELGRCSYSFDKTKDGYKVSSHYQVRTSAQFQQRADRPTGDPRSGPSAVLVTDLEQTHTYKLDAAYTYAGGEIQSSNPRITYSFKLNRGRTTMEIQGMQDGVQSMFSEIPLKPGYVVLPNYDASALQALLYIVAAHPQADGFYYLIVPGVAWAYRQMVQARLGMAGDTSGTLDGKPVTLRHYNFAFGQSIYDVYADGANTLMEADVQGLQASYIRNGFALDSARR
jgi:hypothetical protein